MLNSVVLMGRLSQTPAVKKGINGNLFTTATLAVTNGVNADGSESVMFVDLVAFNEGQKAFDYVDKGDQIAIQGRLDLYTFDKKDGSKGYGTRVIVNSLEFGAKKLQKEEEAPTKEETPKEAPKEENSRRARR